MVDTGSLSGHAEDSERVLRTQRDSKSAWLPPECNNLWGERPAGYCRGNRGDVTKNKLQHPIGPHSANRTPVGSFIQ
eukprot:SAG31_NODE_18791_length_622_cov_1.409178_1_plen_76_part_01